jgi:hypothetical protein
LKLATDAGQQRDGAMLFRTTLEKALFSSPAACVQTLKERLRKLEAKDPAHPDIAQLRELQDLVAAIGPAQFSKFQHLVDQLKAGTHWKWDSRDPSDRLVLFTERIETLKFLQTELPKALACRLKCRGDPARPVARRGHPGYRQGFGSAHSPLRLLIASDVASEGLNLHYQSHRLIHFDISWSLMVFQQRNGRVDRYGQLQVPKIGYMLTVPQHERVRGDCATWRS